MSAQEISVFVCVAILFVIVFCFVAVVRSIARAEVNKALKAYVIGHLIQPRTSKGRFRSRHG